MKGTFASAVLWLGLSGTAVAAELSTTQQAALMDELQACWAIPAGTGKMGRVTVKFRLTKTAELDGKPEVIAPRPEAKLLEASALRAIARCVPFESLAKYPESFEIWRDITVSFEPDKQM